MRPLFQQLVATMRASAAARWASVRQLRAETRLALRRQRETRLAFGRTIRRALQERRASAVASDRVVLAPTNGVLAPAPAGLDDELSADVLRVIVTRPQGVGAREIGNELGVDWRCVPEIARQLVDTGAVEQIDQEFYPAGKVVLK